MEHSVYLPSIKATVTDNGKELTLTAKLADLPDEFFILLSQQDVQLIWDEFKYDVGREIPELWLLPEDKNEWTRLTLEEYKLEGFTAILDENTCECYAHYNKSAKAYDALIEVAFDGTCFGAHLDKECRGTFEQVVKFYNSNK